jgi:hypothetical protein
VSGRVVDFVIDADDDVQGGGVFDGSSDDDAADSLIEIALQLIGFQELAGAFQYHLAAEIAPRHFFRRARCTAADPSISDQNGAIVLDPELLAPAAVQTIELEEVSCRYSSAFELVDMHHLQPIG